MECFPSRNSECLSISHGRGLGVVAGTSAGVTRDMDGMRYHVGDVEGLEKALGVLRALPTRSDRHRCCFDALGGLKLRTRT